jgi:drug/metabolite transporter (DMT)-like permease
MRTLLFVLAIIAVAAGIVVLVISDSASREIVGVVLFLLAGVCLSGGGVIQAVEQLGEEVGRSGTKRA